MGVELEQIDYIAVHCTATPPDQFVDASTIRAWHIERGWSDIGYHVVILRDGAIQLGRDLRHAGAHVAGFNYRSLGVCLVGGLTAQGTPGEKFTDTFTPAQHDSLRVALRFLRLYAPRARVQGHRDFPNVSKDCPTFDVRAWCPPDLLREQMFPQTEPQ